jgi:hypothetical protein
VKNNTATKEWTNQIADALKSSRARRVLTNMLRDVDSQQSEIAAMRSREIYSAAEAERLIATCEGGAADIQVAITTLPECAK